MLSLCKDAKYVGDDKTRAVRITRRWKNHIWRNHNDHNVRYFFTERENRDNNYEKLRTESHLHDNAYLLQNRRVSANLITEIIIPWSTENSRFHSVTWWYSLKETNPHRLLWWSARYFHLTTLLNWLYIWCDKWSIRKDMRIKFSNVTKSVNRDSPNEAFC